MTVKVQKLKCEVKSICTQNLLSYFCSFHMELFNACFICLFLFSSVTFVHKKNFIFAFVTQPICHIYI